QPGRGLLQCWMFGRQPTLRQRDDINCSVPNRRKTWLNSKIFRIVNEQSFEILLRLDQSWMAVRVTERVQCNQRIKHCRINRGQTVAALTDPLDHPPFRFLQRDPTQRFPGNSMQHLERIVPPQEQISPGKYPLIAREAEILVLGPERIQLMELFFAGQLARRLEMID